MGLLDINDNTFNEKIVIKNKVKNFISKYGGTGAIRLDFSINCRTTVNIIFDIDKYYDMCRFDAYKIFYKYDDKNDPKYINILISTYGKVFAEKCGNYKGYHMYQICDKEGGWETLTLEHVMNINI